MMTKYLLIIYNYETGIDVVISSDDLDEAKAHADRVAAMKGRENVFIVESKPVHVGDGKSFLENAEDGDYFPSRSSYKTLEDFQ